MKTSTAIERCDLCKKSTRRLIRPVGNRYSRIAFIVPAPSLEAVEGGYLLADYAGKAFQKYLKTYAYLNIFEGEGLVIPITFCNGKMTQTQTKNCRKHVDYWLNFSEIRLCVICGSAVYQGFFHDGAMPELLAGTVRKEPNYSWDFFFMTDYTKLKEQDDNAPAWKTDLTQRYFEKRLIQECRALGKHVLSRRDALCHAR